jgi:cyanuric acid amidohydrolase
MRVELYRLPVDAPDDVSPLADLIRSGRVRADQISAVIAQNEGDAYARGFTLHVLGQLLSEATGQSREAVLRRVPLLMIGQANVAPLIPHLNVFVTLPEARGSGGAKRLVIGTGLTRDLSPEEYGTMAEVHAVADTVRAAMAEAGLTDPADVHCIYIKTPELSPKRIAEAQGRGARLRSVDLRAAAGLARGAGGLGAALALGEVPEAKLKDDVIGTDGSLFSRVAQVSSGIEQTACSVIVVGNAAGSASDLVAGHCVMKDALDVGTFKDGLRSVGLDFACCPDEAQLARVENLFIATSVDVLPTIRGRRHTIRTDFLWASAGAQAKAFANAVIAGVMGDPMYLSKSGNEHQGPRGSTLVTIFARP